MSFVGFGKTEGDQYSDHGRGEFLYSLVTALGLSHPVIVSPSMSGSFAMPFLVKHSDQLSGFVPVAPTATNTVDQTALATIKVSSTWAVCWDFCLFVFY